MNIETVREYCLSLPLVTEDTAFGPDYILFRVYNKIFACLDLTRPWKKPTNTLKVNVLLISKLIRFANSFY